MSRIDAIDRRVGWMIALGTAFLMLTWLGDLFGQWNTVPPAWNAVSVVLIVLSLTMAGAGLVLPMRVLRVVWAIIPVTALLLVASWPLLRTDPSAGPLGPWIWGFEPAAVGFATAAWRWPVAVAYSFIASTALPLALLAVDGTVPHDLLLQSFIHLGNVAFVVIFKMIHRQMNDLWHAENAAARQAERLARTEADAAEQDRLIAVVHDEVLATLTAVMRTEGPVPEALDQQIRRAKTVVDLYTAPIGDAFETTSGEFADMLRSRVHDIDRLTGWRSQLGTARLRMPRNVVDALVAASAEALRNSLEHAPTRGEDDVIRRDVILRTGEGLVRVEIHDDGSGFDAGRVDSRRLGVRESIVARMRALPGGKATVRSKPGQGTTVTLTWVGP